MRLINIIFLSLILAFLFILGQFFVPAMSDLFRGSLLFLAPFAIFFLLGVVLIMATMKEKIEGRLKKFLLLTGGSAAGFFVSVLLHNFLYALAVFTANIKILHYLFEFLHAAFFLIGVLVCPIGFLVGATGSAVLLTKKGKSSPRYD